MNAEQFYEFFKHGLRAIGLCWGQMGDAQITVDGQYLVMSHGNLSFRFKVVEDA